MELRRALLLFAIVLGLAAIVSSVARPPDGRDRDRGRAGQAKPPSPSASPGPSSRAPEPIRFTPTKRPETKRLDPGRPTTVTVEARRPGLVELEGLGLTAPVERLTPARFDVLASSPRRHRVRYTPAGSNEARTVGVLAIAERN